jgi:signal transduction histidine kinase
MAEASVPASNERTHVRSARDLNEIANGRILGTILRVRARIAVGIALVISAIAWVDPAGWRIGILLAAFSCIAIIATLGRATGEAFSQAKFAASASGIATMQLVVIFALGGIAGPLFPALGLVALILNLLAPGRVGLWYVLGVQFPAVWLLAWVQASGVLPELVPGAWEGEWSRPGTGGMGPWIAATVMTMILAGATTLGRVLRGIVLQLVEEQIADRDRDLELHAETTRSLSRLSAEIAHELKNPLASVKGLAALVRKDLDGTTAERMDVLRREVDRMQVILEEFLAYSRPLVPLDEEQVDLVDLVRDVIALHEGIAGQRGVRLDIVDGDAVHVRCDPRKIRQVVINLLQNAIEATPAGGRAAVEVVRDAREVRVRVIDDGAGIAAGDREKLFQVGFTTKKQGSGIGLVVARGLARQHGGELTLENGEGGGCVATLSLPVNAARAEREAAE